MTDDAMLTAPGEAETWQPVPGFEGLYDSSNRARVRSRDRETVRKDGKTYRLRGKMLTQVPDGQGYRIVALWRDGQRHHMRVHVVIAATFLGPCPDGLEVLHGAAGCGDDRPSNLHYGTRQENMLDKRRDGTHHMAQLKRCKWGHVLAEPNLVPWWTERGYRQCLACSRGRSNVKTARKRHGLLLDMQTESDRHYARIMNG